MNLTPVVRLAGHRAVRIALGPIVAVVIYALLPAYCRLADGSTIVAIPDAGLPDGATALQVRATAAICGWMAIWWLTEAIPMAATALLPLVLLPLAGVASAGAAASGYAHPLIFLFLGGFLLGAAMQHWNLHRRLALRTLLLVGTSPRMMVLGFMIATALLSMWISNTATVVMMTPIALSVVALVESRTPAGEGAGPAGVSLAVPLLLATAYGASIGGLGTLIGTPPNGILAANMSDLANVEIGFAQWMLFGVPIVIVMLPIAWFLLVYLLYPLRGAAIEGGRDILRDELQKLGPMSPAERRVLAIFSLAALGWILRSLLPTLIPAEQQPEWLVAFNNLGDGGIAIAAALLLFLLPAGTRRDDTPDATRWVPVLTWSAAEKSTPWGVLVLFGGGLSLAAAMTSGGLADLIASQAASLEGVDLIWIVAVVALVVVFLTEVTSNTATTAALVPVLIGIAVEIDLGPMSLALPAALAASLAFMLPVATPPNAIVFGSGHLRIPQMARAGFLLNLIGVVVIVAFVMLLGEAVFGAAGGSVAK